MYLDYYVYIFSHRIVDLTNVDLATKRKLSVNLFSLHFELQCNERARKGRLSKRNSIVYCFLLSLTCVGIHYNIIYDEVKYRKVDFFSQTQIF